LALLGATSCGRKQDAGVTRLVDRFKKEMVKGTPAKRSTPGPAAVWNFAEPPAGGQDKTLGWTAANGVTGLSQQGGRLKGHTNATFPIVYVERKGKLDSPDLLFAIEVRMKASKGANVMATTQGQGPLDVKDVLERAKGLQQPWPFSSPILASDDVQTVVLRNARTTRLSSIGKLLISPSDAEGADFEVESVRLISEREHLAGIPSGVTWQGLGEIYRESLVEHSPESIEVPVSLSDKPWLDLEVGTLEESPVTFQVAVGGTVLMQRTITTPGRWEDAAVDLSAYAGKDAVMALSVKGDHDGAVGFWGGSIIRNRNGSQPPGRQAPRADVAGGRVPQGVILVVSDTTRRDHMNFNGYGRETAPTLARLASQGVRFSDNVSQATWTKASFPTIMTSLYTSSNRVKEMNDQLPISAVTMAELFRGAGYATVGYSSVQFHGRLTGLHKGYEEFHEQSSLPDNGSKTARPYVDRLSQWLGAHKDEPFYAVLHVFDAHPPYEPRRPYNNLWADIKDREQYDKDIEKLKTFIHYPDDRTRVMPSLEEVKASGLDHDELMKHFIGWYDGSIRGFDAEVERLMNRLKELGLADKTVIAFTGDHGEEFHEHGRMWHGQTVYGELTNVPLVLYGPGFLPQGVVIDQTVENIDIMPTLLELSHLSPPKNIEGQSLLPLIAAAKDVGSGDPAKLRSAAERLGWRDQPAYSEKSFTGKTGGPRPYNTESYGMVYDGWKLIHNTKRNEGTPEYELFDHKKDPLNRQNVADQHPDVVKRLAPKLEERRASAIAAALPANAATKMNAEEMQRLRGLGYIQ
jgi:arylsulfatase A-like enzyme